MQKRNKSLNCSLHKNDVGHRRRRRRQRRWTECAAKWTEWDPNTRIEFKMNSQWIEIDNVLPKPRREKKQRDWKQASGRATFHVRFFLLLSFVVDSLRVHWIQVLPLVQVSFWSVSRIQAGNGFTSIAMHPLFRVHHEPAMDQRTQPINTRAFIIVKFIYFLQLANVRCRH